MGDKKVDKQCLLFLNTNIGIFYVKQIVDKVSVPHQPFQFVVFLQFTIKEIDNDMTDEWSHNLH